MTIAAMKRDRNLQRLLLLRLRDSKEPPGLGSYSEAELVYNSALLINDGFVEGKAVRGANGEYVATEMTELTSAGHDFLDSFEGDIARGELQEPVKGSLAPQSPPTSVPPPVQGSTLPSDTSQGSPHSESIKGMAAIAGPRIGRRTMFTRTAAGDEIVLGVKGYANVLAKLFRGADERDLCLAIFGPWGRGKTFLMEQTVNKLKEPSAYGKRDYEVVEFKAWKYPSRPEVWVYLYETFFCNLAKGGWFRSLAFTILAGIQRHGVAKLWIAWAALMLTAMPKNWLLKGTIEYLGRFELAVAIAIVFFVVVFVLEFWTTTSHLRRHYLSGTRHFEKLGLQATIGHDLKALLRGWVQVDVRSKRIRVGLRSLWAAAIALVGFIFWRSHEALSVAFSFSLVVVGIPSLVSLAFMLSGPSPSRILLVVDDLDRCQFDHLLSVMESIKLLLEDPDISKRVQVVMLVEEDVLKHAIWNKYKSLTDADAQKALGTAYDGRRVVRENLDKLFTAHLRLTPLTLSEISEVIMAFSGSEKPQQLPSPTHAPSAPQPSSVVQMGHELDSGATISEDEKLVILSALQSTYGDKHSELGPRAIRAFMFRYQLARLILEELDAQNWSPALLAKMIAARQFAGAIELIRNQDETDVMITVAEQVA